MTPRTAARALTAALALGIGLIGAARAVAQTGAVSGEGDSRPVVEETAMHLLGADPRQLRFEGETDSRVFPVFLTGAQASARARVHLSYTNAVSVMPETSRLKVSVNDVVVAETPIASPASNDTSILDLDIPAGLLEPGYNALKFEVQQRHRVDCSLSATYELWTQIDPAATGLAFSGRQTETITDLADLPAVAPDGHGATPLRIVVPKGTEPGALDRILRTVQVVAIRGRFTHPVVTVVDAPMEAPGVDVVVGTVDELKGAGLSDYLGDDQPTALRAGATPGHSVLIVAAVGIPELDAAIDALLKPAADRPAGTPAGLRALAIAGGKPVEGGVSLTLRDLGVASQEFSGRLFRAGFDLLMPPDFYAADYAKITLRIDAGYVGGLDPSSQILVRVNERDAASLPLPNPKGDVFRHRPITVSLADFRPGFNHVQIEAQVGAPADKVCDTAAAATGEPKKRFVLLDGSGLELPAIARIAHMPSLAVTAASGFPYLAASAETRLYLPHPDADTVGAAATFLVRAALSAGTALATKLVVGKTSLDATSAIIVGSLADVPATMAETVGLDVAATRDVWSHIEAKSVIYAQDSGDKRDRPSLKPSKAPTLASGDGGREDSALFRKWAENVSAGHWQFDAFAFASNLLEKAVGLSRTNLDPWSRVESKYVPDPRSRLVVAQHRAPGGGAATWTMVVAPSAELLASGVGELTSPSTWNQLDGRMASLDPKARVATVLPATQGYFIQTAPLSPGNMRLIAAGWLSSYLEYYVLGLVALSLGLGLTTTAVVRRYGVQVR